MGSMGFLLADWSIELIRTRNRKSNKQNKMRGEKLAKQCWTQTEATDCTICCENTKPLASLDQAVVQYEMERKCLKELLSCDEIGLDVDIIKSVENILKEASKVNSEIEQLKQEKTKMAESVGRQLQDKDTNHSEKVKSLEIVMNEKEKQMLQSSNLLRQQLTTAKTEVQQLQKQVTKLEADRKTTDEGSLDQEQEIDCLMEVLGKKKEEMEKLKAANNSLSLELERFAGLEVKLQVQNQRLEEMNAVINMKNDQLRQVLDEYDKVQEQLEIEVSSHLACQEELELSQWNKETFLLEYEKLWKEVENEKRSGLILDVVQKDKALSYSFTC